MTTIVPTRGHRFINITGRRFGRLVVDSLCEEVPSDGKLQWKCICDCGNIKNVRGTHLRKGSVKSCGCLWFDTISLPKGTAAINYCYKQIVSGAKSRGFRCSLTLEEFVLISSRDCYYCGVRPHLRGRSNSNGKYKGHGLDRVNNELGYSINNVVSCCRRCNVAKATMTVNEFTKLVLDIFKNLKLGA